MTLPQIRSLLLAIGALCPERPARSTVARSSASPAASSVRLRVRLCAPRDWPFPVEWLKDGQPLAHATARELVLSATSLAEIGDYTLAAPRASQSLSVRLEKAL